MDQLVNGPGRRSASRESGVLAEHACHAIKRSIIPCELEPGQQVTEEQLGTRVGVGRAAVRTALKRLYQERLIHGLSRNRHVIAPITLKHVNELFDVRLPLEPPAARMAAARIDAELLRRLEELCGTRYEIGNRESAAERSGVAPAGQVWHNSDVGRRPRRCSGLFCRATTGSPAVHGEYKTPGGKLVVVDCEVRDGRVVDAQVSGDFFLEPAEALTAITAAIEGMPADLDEEAIAARVRAALAPDVAMIGFSPEAVARAVRRALA